MKHTLGLKPLAMSLLALAAFATAAADASAQGRASRQRQRPAAEAGPQLDRERGAREAPAAVQAAGLTCTVADAAFVGSSNDTVNGVAVTRNVYEVACQDSLGFVIFQPPAGAGPSVAHDCIVIDASFRAAEAKGQSTGLQCRLPGNAQPAQGLRSLVAQTGGTCTIGAARYVGELAQLQALRYEITCSEGPGYFIDRPRGQGTPARTSCLAALGSPNACTLTTREQTLASLTPLVAQAQRQCTVANARMVGASRETGSEVVEIGCEPGRPGFFLEIDKQGKFSRTLECGRISNTPCQFTAPEVAQAAARVQVQERLRTAGSDCTVGELRSVGAEQRSGREIYEVTCTNRPHGAFMALASTTNPKSDVYDCLFAPYFGTTCQLTQESQVYPRLATAMTIRGQNPGCQVRNSRWMGRTDQGENWFELGCADGRTFVVDYRSDGKVANTLTCREAANIGSGCRAGDRGSVRTEAR